MKAVETTKSTGQASMERTCQCFDLHRNAYYQVKKRKAKRDALAHEVIELVIRERIEEFNTVAISMWEH